VGTTNVGFRARLASPFIVALRERGPTAIHGRRPRSGRVSDRETDPEIRPEITFLTTPTWVVDGHSSRWYSLSARVRAASGGSKW
jgi:hypothetical protein